MKNYLKKYINIIISIFILLQPILDLITGLFLHVLNINLTLGIIIKLLFILFLIFITVFGFNKKKLIIPYILLIIYGLFYCFGMIIYKDSSLFVEIQNLVKTFYFPVLLLTLYSIKDEFRISKLTLFTTLFMYLLLIFVPTLFGIGFKTYEITKAGTLGFYNSANEISGIISILTPIVFLIFKDDNNPIKKTIYTLIFLVVILMMGTKTPLLSLGITVGVTFIYLWTKSIKRKDYKPILYSFIGLVIAIGLLIVVIPKTNFYKNIETHLNYLKLDSVFDVFEDEELVDHFIFSSRLKFLKNKARIYSNSSTYEKLFGIGYINNNKTTKMIEMDYFDIFYSHGIIGFILFFSIVLPIIYKLLVDYQKRNYERFMLMTSFVLIIFLSFFTGHIITAPSVSLISVILILYLGKRQKRDVLFASYSLEIGGIEKALQNLVNSIDKNKYNVTIVLEEKQGELLKKIDKNIVVKEVKVNNNKNIIVRKTINYLNKQIYKIFNYKNYDFSCCYATYSKSSSKISLMSSNNSYLYVHSNYRHLYNNEEFKQFFDERNINSYRRLIFVSKESKEGFIELYKDYINKCIVINNFIDIDEIKELSKKEKIKRRKNKLLVFIGRLDDSSKKLSRQIKLVKEINNLDLWIVGDGPDREKYEQEVKKYNLNDRITFFGSKSNPYPYMNEADYIILTSDYEGFPVTYLEALCLNKSIITTIPTSDEYLNIEDYAYIISKDQTKMIKEVKKILESKEEKKIIDLDSIQKKRMGTLERLFNEVV
ncbi:MAG: O-antigen ligase family protein [Bacilli bacterium]|nr:O-antigen ligase family protein [Bacilli bacterium]